MTTRRARRPRVTRIRLGGLARSLLSIGVVISALVVGQQPALAAQHQGGAVHVYWTLPASSWGNLWNIDQVMWVEQKATKTYWAMQFGLAGTADSGYMGLQTGATRPDGTVGEMAIFSLWNADKTRGGVCAAFSGEGNGLSCRKNYSFSTNTQYRYRVWRTEVDATGAWWGAWIRNQSTGAETALGEIHIAQTMLNPPLNFTEYWGDAVACTKVPKSIVNWTQPAGNYSGVSSLGYQYYSSYQTYDSGACISKTVQPKNYGWTQGVRVVAGSV